MDVVILTEGGKDYGYGHVARCSSIYQAFEHYGISPMFIVNGDDSINSILSDCDVKIQNWLNDSFHSDIIVIDSYIADLDFYKKLSKDSSLVVNIDDNNRLVYPGGIVVNGTLDASNIGYSQRENTRNLIGGKFIPLRKEFWDVDCIPINDSIESILITMGGNDLRNLTPKLLELLNENFPKINKKVIISGSFKNVSEIESLKDDFIDLIYSPDSNEIMEVMSSVDLAISTSGQTLYELACLGIPTIAIGVIDNQKNNINNWINQGFIEYAGCWNNKDILSNVLDKINLLQNKKSRLDRQILGNSAVSGEGAINIVKEVLNEFYKNNSVFRPIHKDDCLKIFEIANDDEVRKYSFNSEKIPLESHKIWFDKILNDNSVKFHVLEYKNDLIGQLRLDYDEEFPVISISLNKKYRGLGLSKVLLAKGLELVDGKVIAYIKKENTRSINFFTSMGFKKESDIIIKNCEALKFIKE